jgi:hypothetical protein
VASIVVVTLGRAVVVSLGAAVVVPMGVVTFEFAFEPAATADDPPAVAATIPDTPATAATPKMAMVIRGWRILCPPWFRLLLTDTKRVTRAHRYGL